MYARPSRCRILSLKESLSRATKGSQSMTSYLEHIKQLVTPLNSTGANLTLDDVTLHALQGLPPEQRGISDSIRTRDTPLSFDELHEMLCDYEQYIQRDQGLLATPLTANIATLNSFTSRDNITSKSYVLGYNINRTVQTQYYILFFMEQLFI